MRDTEIIIVSNGSTDGTEEYIKSIQGPHIRGLIFNRLLGFPRAINEGVKAISNSTTHVILINNDCTLVPQPHNNWINILMTLISQPDVGISGPLRLYENILKQYYIMFFLVMIKREVFEKIGLLDEVFGLGNADDVEFCIRAKQNGFKIAHVPVVMDAHTTMKLGSFPVVHLAHQTVSVVEGFYEGAEKNSDVMRSRYPNLPPEPFEMEVYKTK
jgi:GT2 family glycosyltransferase